MKCAFCNTEVEKGKGFLYAKKDGSTYLFCSTKCRNNQLGLKRVGKKAPWVRRRKKPEETKKAKKTSPQQKK